VEEILVFFNVCRLIHKSADRNTCTLWHQLNNRKWRKDGLAPVNLKTNKYLGILVNRKLSVR
jgi:hypothetical protein